jgi:hypothetical protein
LVTVFACAACAAPIVASSPVIIEETTRLVSPEAQFPFTGPLAIHGNTMAVASNTQVIGGDYLVAVFIYERPTATAPWLFARKLTEFAVPYGYDGSMIQLDVTSNAIAIVAVGYSSVFEREGSQWIERKLASPANADFPSDVAISGATVVAGGKDTRINGYVYEKSADGTWPLTSVLRADTNPYGDNDYFGENVDIDGSYAAVVSPDSIFAEPLIGHLYVFRKNGAGQWAQAAALNDPSTPSSPYSGAHVSVLSLAPNIGVAAVHKVGEEGVSIFTETTPSNWSTVRSVRQLDALMSEARGPFGGNQVYSRLELTRLSNGPALAFSAPSDEDRGSESGSVSIFKPRTTLGAWGHSVKFLASDARPGLKLGSSTAFFGDTVAAIGSGGLYIFKVPSEIGPPAKIQDDFQNGNAAGWLESSGDWSITSSLGSRVYRQNSNAGEYVTTRSGIDWRNVAIEADVRPLGFSGNDRWVSLMSRYADDQNYYYVALRNTNVLRLAKRVGNTFTTLASTTLPVTVNRTYRVRLETVGTWVRAYVNGELKLEARDTTHQRGGVGLKTSFAQAQFDNVLVSQSPQTALLRRDFTPTGFDDDTFHREPAANWSSVSAGSNNWAFRQSSPYQASRAIAGVEYASDEPQLADHIVEARVRAQQFGSADALFGVMARFRDNSNYVSAVLTRNGEVRLRQNSNGNIRILDSTPVPIALNTWYRIRLEAVGDRLRVYVNNLLHLEARDTSTDSSNTRGRYGLLAVGTVTDFDDVRVREP